MTATNTSGARGAGWKRFYPLIIVLLGFAVYSNTFQVPFHFDDGIYIVNNPAVKDFSYYVDSARAGNAIVQARMEPNFQTRKLSFFTFALNYRLHGFSLAGYHVVNLFMHLICGLLIYRLVLLTVQTPLFRKDENQEDINGPYSVAVLAALLFIVHPVQTESVTYISQRFTTMAAMLYLTSLVLYIHWRLRTSNPETPDQLNQHSDSSSRLLLYWGAVLAAFLAMFTKEIAFTLPIIIVLYEIMFFGRPSIKRMMTFLPFIATMLIIPEIVFEKDAEFQDVAALSDSIALDGDENPMLSYLFTQFRVIVTYIRLLLLPINQNIDYDYPRYSSFLQAPVALSFVLLCLLAGLAVILYIRAARLPASQGRWHRLASFSICWFFITLSVESTIMPLADLIFEHRLYLPSVGFFLGTLGVVEMARPRLGGGVRILVIFLIVATASLAVASYVRNALWQEPLAFWEDTVRKSPNKARPHLNMGAAYKIAERFDEAMEQYTLALHFSQNRKTSTGAYTAMEEIHQRRRDDKGLQNNYTEHLNMLLKDLAWDSNDPSLFNDLGVIYSKMNRNHEAEAAFRRAIELKNNIAMPYLNLGNLYSRQNRMDESLVLLSKAAELDPDNEQVQMDLGDDHAARGNFVEALRAYQRAQELNPDSIDICFKIAYHLVMMGKSGEADTALQQMTARKKNDARFFHELAVYYERSQRVAEAEEAFRKALQLNDKMAIVYTNIGAFYLRQGQIDKALENLTQAARLDPSNPDVHYNFGYAYAEMGDYASAAKSYQRVLELSPSDTEARQQFQQMMQLLQQAGENGQPNAHSPKKIH